MTKRERVLTALRRGQPDRVPKGELWIDGGLANRLLGSDYPLDYQHFGRDLAVREFLNIDLINLGDWPETEIGTDENGNRRFQSIYGHEYITTGTSKHISKPPIDDIEDAAGYTMPDISQVSGMIISNFKTKTDLFITGQIGGPVSMLDEMFPMDDYLTYCLTNTSEIRSIAEKVMEYEIAKAKLFIDSGADAIVFADDIAFNSGLFLPPRIMKEVAYPFYRSTVEAIKGHKDVPVIFHSDGDLNLVMRDIIDAGFDCLQSIQPTAGMDIAKIKKEYGREICLMGNLDLNYIMTFATPEEVDENVRQTMEIAAPGGGYILSTCNTLIDSIPAANALAMYRAGDKYGRYMT